MGNSNFLGYAAGAYNYQEEKRRKDAEEALERQYKQMQLNSMRQRQAEFEYQKSRDRKYDEIEDKKWKIEKEGLDEARQSKALAPIIKPYVPYLNRDTPGKSTLEVPLPNKVMGNILSATGMPAIGLPGLPENAIPGQVNFENFLTGDEQSSLLKSQQKLAEKEAMIDFEVKKRRALADAGVIRDYNRDPVGSRSKSTGTKGSKKYDLYAEPTATVNTKEPITAPTIQAFQPYKSYEEVLYRGTPEEQAAMSQLFQAENEKLKNSTQAQKNALALLNRSRKDSHAQSVAEAEKQRKKSEAAKLPKIDAGPEIYDKILQFYGFSPEEIASATSGIPGKASPAPASSTQTIPTQPPAASQQPRNPQSGQSIEPIVAPQIAPAQPLAPITQQPPALSLEDQQKTIIQNQLAQRQLSPEFKSQQLFNDLIGTISRQTGRSLTDDERGFIADQVFAGQLDGIIFDWANGTYTKPGAGTSKPIKELITSNIGNYAAENAFAPIVDARSQLANWLKGSLLTEKGVKALSDY